MEKASQILTTLFVVGVLVGAAIAWGWLGVLAILVLIGMAIAAIISVTMSDTTQVVSRARSEPLGARDEKVCPYCAESIKAAANKCRYCHSNVG